MLARLIAASSALEERSYMPTVQNPALLAASVPLRISSNTAHCAGFNPKRAAGYGRTVWRVYNSLKAY